MKTGLKHVLLVAVWGIAIGAIFLFSYLIYLRITLPDPETIASRQVKESTRIYDRTGTVVLYDIYKEEQRTIIPDEKIPKYLKEAVVSAEDANFYKHRGLDIKGILRAIVKNLSRGELSQGGSTITQQLVKNALLGQEKTFSRKLREWMLAIEVERHYSKDQILAMYLNQIPYGSTYYGVEAASQAFFSKSVVDVSLPEAAILAAIIQSPSRLSPFGTHQNDLFARKDQVLSCMASSGSITAQEYDDARTQKIVFSKGLAHLTAPHFVLMAKEYLSGKYGEDSLTAGGYKIITTLDATLQKLAEELVAKYAAINKNKYKASNLALVAIDPRNGDILALVGSADYFDVEEEGNFNIATALRQPGSAFKPFAYAEAFLKGFPDTTILFDVQTEFNPNCNPDSSQKTDPNGQECYHPQNYDGRFRGPVNLRQALAQSLNVPSVKTLYLAGIQDTISLAEKMGISTLANRDRFGLSLVLGGAEVRLVDLISAYGVFANDGIRNPWFLIQRVETPQGSVLEDHASSSTRVLPQQTARMINDILSDNAARAPVFGFSSPLFVPGRSVAAKTGTTQNNRDAWTLGYVPSLAVGVWAGNNHNEPMTQAGAGINAAGPLWHEFMQRALVGSTQEHFPAPDPMISDKVMLSGSYLYKDGSLDNIAHTILYYIDPNKLLEQKFPEHPENNPQFTNWEWAVRRFFGL